MRLQASADQRDGANGSCHFSGSYNAGRPGQARPHFPGAERGATSGSDSSRRLGEQSRVWPRRKAASRRPLSIKSGDLRYVTSALQPIGQLFDALRAQARDAAAIGTASPMSITGTTLTSFQKLYFETNATMTFGSRASTRT